MTLYLDTPALKVYADESLQLIVIQANGTVPTATYRHGLSLATEIAIERKFPFWLVNNREGGIITPEDQIWATEVNAPRLAEESAIRKMALIEPKDLHSKLILEDLMDNVRDIYPFEMQFFEDVPSAHAWFRDTEATVFRTTPPAITPTDKK
ncbi:hypothetical protein ACFS7Z_04405 [Pontibacter toksunensis]|uniref:STAS/SEC14 domain-containing protein n=1 Tax=Pontibacter toksunensis TaxID=1332631 RepID=A0ABW6BRM1_9BACT